MSNTTTTTFDLSWVCPECGRIWSEQPEECVCHLPTVEDRLDEIEKTLEFHDKLLKELYDR